MAAVAAVLILVGLGSAYRAANVRRANQVLAEGLAELRSNNWNQAAETLSKVATDWPNTRPGRIGLVLAAQAELRAKRFNQAEAKLLAAERSSGLSPYLQQQLLLARALTLEASGQYGEAAAYAERAAELTGPYTAASLYEAARLFTRAGNPTKARQLAEKLGRDHASAPEANWLKFLHPSDVGATESPAA